MKTRVLCLEGLGNVSKRNQISLYLSVLKETLYLDSIQPTMKLSPDNLEKKILQSFPRVPLLEEWSLVRISIHFEYINSFYQKFSSHHYYLKKIKNVLCAITRVRTLFKNFDIIVFSDSTEYQKYNSSYANKLFRPLFETYENILYVERVVPSEHSLIPFCGISILNSAVFQILGKIFWRLFRSQSNYEIIEKFCNDTLICKVDLKKNCKNLQCYKFIFFLFFKWKNPKAIFLSDSYNTYTMGLIAAAKKLGIPTVEQQHGIINYEHFAYNFYGKQRPLQNFYPDYLLTFGPMVLKEIGRSSFIEPNRIHNCGHPYLDYLSQKTLYKTKDNSNIAIGITLLWIYEKKIISFISEVSDLLLDVEFILIPRNTDDERYGTLKLPINVRIERKKKFYELMAEDIDIHCTVNSTTAVEAPYFGVPNILLDFDGEASRYYKSLLPPSEINHYVNTTEEFVHSLQKLKSIDHNIVHNFANELYTQHYSYHLKNFISDHLNLHLKTKS